MKVIILPAEQAQAILNYLQKQPWSEANPHIHALMNAPETEATPTDPPDKNPPVENEPMRTQG